MSDIDPTEMKRLVVDRALELGASLVRSCPTDRWEKHPIQDRPYWPRSIWPWAENAIVMGIPMFAPMVATTPSMVHQELYNTSNRILDDMAYRMTAWLRAEEIAPSCRELRKINAMQAISAMVKITRKAISHGLVF